MGESFMKDFNGSKVFSLEYDKETLRDMVLEKQKENERLHNIIKEVREYIENNIGGCFGGEFKGSPFELLEILDKEKSNDELYNIKSD